MRHLVSTPVLLMAALLEGSLLPGCNADCETACKKLMEECNLDLPSSTVTQCEAECSGVREGYAEKASEAATLDMLQTELNCIRDTSCDQLLDVDSSPCYNNRLYVFPIRNESQ